MGKEREVISTQDFQTQINKISGTPLLEKLKKQIRKIVTNPDFGKPLMHGLAGYRTVYVKPYRILYSFDDNTILLVKFEHRKKVYL
ncbi:MAG: type II toxin-antitoxin system RelE/ParE family toxin [Candidatus Aenigmarchaeota archaeon]|nr:type II toxin-antitoxin system RelE/ParE family toxin [Candidatus Aenigmarchaeota archaeon]